MWKGGLCDGVVGYNPIGRPFIAALNFLRLRQGTTMRVDFTPAQLSLFHSSKGLNAGNVRQIIREEMGRDVDMDTLTDKQCEKIEAKIRTVVLSITFIDDDHDDESN